MVSRSHHKALGGQAGRRGSGSMMLRVTESIIAPTPHPFRVRAHSLLLQFRAGRMQVTSKELISVCRAATSFGGSEPQEQTSKDVLPLTLPLPLPLPLPGSGDSVCPCPHSPALRVAGLLVTEGVVSGQSPSFLGAWSVIGICAERKSSHAMRTPARVCGHARAPGGWHRVQSTLHSAVCRARVTTLWCPLSQQCGDPRFCMACLLLF